MKEIRKHSHSRSTVDTVLVEHKISNCTRQQTPEGRCLAMTLDSNAQTAKFIRINRTTQMTSSEDLKNSKPFAPETILPRVTLVHPCKKPLDGNDLLSMN